MGERASDLSAKIKQEKPDKVRLPYERHASVAKTMHDDADQKTHESCQKSKDASVKWENLAEAMAEAILKVRINVYEKGEDRNHEGKFDHKKIFGECNLDQLEGYTNLAGRKSGKSIRSILYKYLKKPYRLNTEGGIYPTTIIVEKVAEKVGLANMERRR